MTPPPSPATVSIPAFLVNWKTTGTGVILIAAGLAKLFHVSVQGIDVPGDPGTMIVTGIGLVLAKDAGK